MIETAQAGCALTPLDSDQGVYLRASSRLVALYQLSVVG